MLVSPTLLKYFVKLDFDLAVKTEYVLTLSHRRGKLKGLSKLDTEIIMIL